MLDMPEFCLSCWRTLKLTNNLPRRYIISLDADCCELCGKWKPLLIDEKSFFEDWAEMVTRYRAPPET